jgi:hypothetical protein
LTQRIQAIGFVEAPRLHAEDGFWGGSQVRIALTGRSTARRFSVTGARHPGNNQAWPAVGIFPQRARNLPNPSKAPGSWKQNSTRSRVRR